MVSFVLYEDSEALRIRYKRIIDKFIGKSTLAYRIFDINKYDSSTNEKIKTISGNKIYIVDIEVPGKSGLDFARDIRINGDWNSQIIIVSCHESLKNYNFLCQNLMLGFISKYDNVEAELLKYITQAYKIVSSNESLKFQKNGEIYQIPYNNILYIEKLPDEIYCSVETEGISYLTNMTMSEIEKLIHDDPRFVKTHRSYIVNCNNIKRINLEESKMYFTDKKVAYFSRNYRRQIKDRFIKTKI